MMDMQLLVSRWFAQLFTAIWLQHRHQDSDRFTLIGRAFPLFFPYIIKRPLAGFPSFEVVFTFTAWLSDFSNIPT